MKGGTIWLLRKDGGRGGDLVSVLIFSSLQNKADMFSSWKTVHDMKLTVLDNDFFLL